MMNGCQIMNNKIDDTRNNKTIEIQLSKALLDKINNNYPKTPKTYLRFMLTMLIAIMTTTMIMETIGSLSTNDADGLQTKDILETTSKMTTNLQLQEGYAALLSDFSLLTNEEAFLANLEARTEGTKHLDSQMTQFDVIESLMVDEDGFLTTLHPLAFAAKANNKNTPNYSQAMNGLDALGYKEAMEKEMQHTNWRCSRGS
jgi:hypothetical protein